MPSVHSFATLTSTSHTGSKFELLPATRKLSGRRYTCTSWRWTSWQARCQQPGFEWSPSVGCYDSCGKSSYEGIGIYQGVSQWCWYLDTPSGHRRSSWTTPVHRLILCCYQEKKINFSCSPEFAYPFIRASTRNAVWFAVRSSSYDYCQTLCCLRCRSSTIKISSTKCFTSLTTTLPYLFWFGRLPSHRASLCSTRAVLAVRRRGHSESANTSLRFRGEPRARIERNRIVTESGRRRFDLRCWLACLWVRVPQAKEARTWPWVGVKTDRRWCCEDSGSDIAFWFPFPKVRSSHSP